MTPTAHARVLRYCEAPARVRAPARDPVGAAEQELQCAWRRRGGRGCSLPDLLCRHCALRADPMKGRSERGVVFNCTYAGRRRKGHVHIRAHIVILYSACELRIMDRATSWMCACPAQYAGPSCNHESRITSWPIRPAVHQAVGLFAGLCTLSCPASWGARPSKAPDCAGRKGRTAVPP